ncbi:MAG TPA: GAF domain-containing protein, partial [Polyangiaceae bacterium]|nr:GAF domain-containing protein [Polyangiaceae bacterium]
IYGLEPGSREVTFEFYVSALHPEDRDSVQREVWQTVEGGGRFSHLKRIVRPDGSIRVLDCLGEAALGEDGKVLGLIGTCRDVTEERKLDETIRLYANIVENVQIALTVWRLADPEQAREATLVGFNPAAEQVTRYTLADWLGKSISEISPRLAETELLQLLNRVAHEETVHELDEFEFGTQFFSIKGFPLPGGCVGLAMEDVTPAVRARNLREVEQTVLEMIASGEPLKDVLASLALMIQEQAPSTIASILLLDPDGKRLRHAAAPHLPEIYTKDIDGAQIGPRAGSCGTAAFLRRAVFVADIETDPLWSEYKHLALPHGLRASWSTPIFSSEGRVLGTFALYYREPRTPGAADLELIARATHVAGIAIQRRELDDQLRALSAHIEAVREEERTTMAREIHDDLGQALTALKMDVAWIARRLGSGEDPRGAIADKLMSMSALTDQVIDRVRRISAELRPGMLDDLGLVAALQWQGQQFQARTDTICTVHANVGEGRLERGLSTAIFRICQEALTNVARHAEAKSVQIVLERQDGVLRLEVRDDGRGISSEAASNAASLGLLGMRERARRLSGNLRISGAPGSGTLVVVEVPFEAAAQAQ